MSGNSSLLSESGVPAGLGWMTSVGPSQSAADLGRSEVLDGPQTGAAPLAGRRSRVGRSADRACSHVHSRGVGGMIMRR